MPLEELVEWGAYFELEAEAQKEKDQQRSKRPRSKHDRIDDETMDD